MKNKIDTLIVSKNNLKTKLTLICVKKEFENKIHTVPCEKVI